MKSGVMDEVKRLFKPEFINRIDEIMVFHQLSNEEMMQIVTLLSSSLAKRCKEQLNIKLTISSAVKKHLVDKYSEQKMGARPLKRAIQTVIEDSMAEELLKGNIKRDSEVVVGIKDGTIVFTSKAEKAAKAASKAKSSANKKAKAKKTPAKKTAEAKTKKKVGRPKKVATV
jgi:ATP-dependent Clp protease ATP-binding subunit ClpC